MFTFIFLQMMYIFCEAVCNIFHVTVIITVVKVM